MIDTRGWEVGNKGWVTQRAYNFSLDFVEEGRGEVDAAS